MRTIVFAAVAVMLALQAQAQAPPVPQYICNNPPLGRFQNDAMQLVMAFPAWQRPLLVAQFINGAVQAWTDQCERDFRARMLRWQAEMQRSLYNH